MSENTNLQTEIALPTGYEFVDASNMLPEEIFAVRQTTGWEQEEPAESRDGWLAYPQSALASVGVRNTETDELVGVGFIVGNSRHAVLADFNVRPDHQNIGIGTSILQERVRIADDLHIPYLYTSLAETNPLATKYRTFGFLSSNNNYIRSDRREITSKSPETSLESYDLVGKDSILPEEIIALRKAVGWEPGETEEGWLKNIAMALAVVGTRDKTNGSLVGIGFLVGNSRHAILCDFTVRPDHQGQGLGTAILQERMRIAEEMKIPYLYTSLAETNPLAEKYKSLGFVATGSVYFRNNASNK